MEKMMRVLLANSNEDFTRNLSATLRQTERYAIVGTAPDGVSAMELLRQLKPETAPDFAKFTRIETYDADMQVYR